MEGKDQARVLYIKSFNNETALGSQTMGQVSKSVKKLVRDSLSRIERKCRFEYQEFWAVIEKTAERGKLIPDKAAEAFKNLEKYFILLYKMPWKREFRKLKTYCGFFQSKIRSHLEDPESIICLVGFQPDTANTLVLKGEPDLQLIIAVAFECVVATVECEMLSEFHRKMKEGGANVSDVVRWRDTGVLPAVKNTEDEDRNGFKTREGESRIDSAYASAAPSSVRNKVVLAGATGGVPRNLPFIDEDDHFVDDTGYVEGTIDEHYMASLQRLSQNPQRQAAPQSGSDDWAFVREGLETKYGTKYFDGARGDVIRNSREHIRLPPRDEQSDEGIDIEEEPPAVNIEHPPVRISPRSQVTSVSQDRTMARESSGYRTGSSQVFYPPSNLLSGPAHHPQPLSPGATSVGTSAYVSQTSYNSAARSQVPIVARGVTPNKIYPNIDTMARKPNIIQRDGGYRPQTYTTSGDVGASMARRMNDLGVPDTGRWNCHFCSGMNDNQIAICRVCGKSRGPEIDGPKCGDSITECKKCTYENPPGTQICDMCGTPLEKSNVHTYV
ncbi:uncharacterized protein LOC124135299 [Haliotis rufescens]|uniref:uncharacterized protein LOC124135299 n=1 Tax=Haliotis rufescens TaxID=6454 RepID=UPI001EAFAC26|nr:uncharacterized protein LOC124135299 [Haliotis rufescens]XP_046356527.1 uncharacterized protein LOC124135299 [Haliotis rufescens]XP_048254955.1 uncharacterized protein LOC124135299 [Haliotis rufescens]